MKNKILSISILLMGLLYACNTSSSEQFNPGLDGYWSKNLITSDHEGMISYIIKIDYPHIHGCMQITGDSLKNKANKEDIEVAHKDGPIYEVIKDNGDPAGPDGRFVKMRLGSESSSYIIIGSKDPEYGEFVTLDYNKGGSSNDYHTCRQTANYSKKLF